MHDFIFKPSGQITTINDSIKDNLSTHACNAS